MKILRWTYKSLRGVIVTLIVMVALIPAVLFVGLSLPPVQNLIRQKAETELCKLLGVDVEIGRVGIAPFSSITLRDVVVHDTDGKEALRVKKLGAGIDLMHLFRGDILVTYAELYDMAADIYRATPGSPLNIQPIIDNLKPKDPNKPPTRFDLAINTVVIRKSELHYNVLDQPVTDRFNPSHIDVYDLQADVTLPRVSNKVTVIDIRRLAFTAENGITVTSLSGKAEVTPSLISLTDLDISLPASRLKFGTFDLPLKSDWRSMPVDFKLMSPSHINPSDFSGFMPRLASLDFPVALEMHAEGTPRHLILNRLHVSLPENILNLRAKGQAINLTEGMEAMSLALEQLDLHAEAPRIVELAGKVVAVPEKLGDLLTALGSVDLKAYGSGSLKAAEIAATLSTAAGKLDLESRIERNPSFSVSGTVFTEGINLGALMPEVGPMHDLGIDADVYYAAGNPQNRRAALKGSIRNMVWHGYSYADISTDLELIGTEIKAMVDVDDPNLGMRLNGYATIPPGESEINIAGDIAHFNPNALGLIRNYPGYELDLHLESDLAGKNIDNVTGRIDLTDLNFSNPSNPQDPDLKLRQVSLSALTDTAGRHLEIASEVINGHIDGKFRFATLIKSAKGILARINPEIFPRHEAEIPLGDDTMTLSLVVEPDNPVSRFIHLPVGIITPVTLNGSIDAPSATIDADIIAPYLQQKDKLIEGTALHISANGLNRNLDFSAATILPTKAGPMTLNLVSTGRDGIHDTSVDWNVSRKPNNGLLRFTTTFARDSLLSTTIRVNPGRIVFNDTVWTVAPSDITIANNRVKVNDFRISHRDQLVNIEGEASRDTTSQLTLTLRDINLDYVFETLNIPNVSFGGDATGVFHASRLFSKTPRVFTDNLFVKNLSYNHCVMGDGHICSAWHPEGAGDITIDAVIDEPDGRHSYVNGSVHPTRELLDFRFKADKAPVGFLQPFMEAFCDDISGYASGDAHLYGTFKLLDMTGDVYGEDLAMHIGFTNTTYHTSDSVHIAPGRIEIDKVTITDDRGHTATLSGLLTHKDFKEPRFLFRVTDARDFLAYDMRENTEHPWFGKVFGTGSVTIAGEPGKVDINVDMATGEGTDFTFVLSDAEVAADYNFLTFRDKTPPELKKAMSAGQTDTVPEIVRALRERIRKANEEIPTAYAMTFNIDVTPAAKINLIMDPVGGDKIQATGSGNIRMSYDSSNEELKMYGTYTLNHGSYNFTLQDIIIKEFTIEDGSSISFHGDPYSAQLNIRAYYALNANLSDLDESFLQDRELNRTNVPVHAVLNVTGDMRSPDIAFDLAFPTLTQDTYRKVRSIVSTEDMMNRQIIYLLALNRFYTPDYMNTTSGNELVSVASSTISSQLSNILGQLSDKFSIAPSIRSDRGDFSDVEVDVALSSHLLNNRLLLNGNFGYRDKSLNDNSFIGDFDIEYLLNRSGSIRLKAYNRYNDQNYYLKSALTTQGVGIVFKRDFDNMFDFIRRLRRKKSATPADSTDSITDTIPSNGKLPTD